MKKRTGACLRCYKFNGYNPIETGFFCSVGCKILYSEVGPLDITEEEKNKIYEESYNKTMTCFLSKFKKPLKDS